ncbi:phosphomannomutase [Alishewanella tabrizica]|uniref:Phosphomannomutase n=1 Tax=Alishewanella tabrizica TaxID=671278 RepID=A0ABQ2WIV3_9ALTE|nr:phosphomannomutase [Alishewanella tabrizica]GGW58717.1 phosphomannomutase [Alishewanella tabrizica]
MTTLNSVLANSHVAFGTSGARGLVTDFTDNVCAAFTQSFVRTMQQDFTFSAVAIGIDNRPSSPAMAAACIGLLHAMGIKAEYYGVLPTPALAYQAMQDKIPAIMITGSHIPFDRNGIKFYRPDGEISKADEVAILTVIEPLLAFKATLPAVDPTATQGYIDRYLNVYAPKLLAGKHIGIYEHSSAGRELYYRVFEALGAKVTRLERSDVFVPIDTEAVTQADIDKGLLWAKEYAFDAIFSTDGDGDRPLIADEQGNWLRGDIVGLLCAQALGIDALAVPVSCNTAIEHSGVFDKVLRTKIGSPYVIAAFADLLAYTRVAGFEANGGFLLGSDILLNNNELKALPTRDALLPVLALLALAGERPLSALVDALPKRVTASDRLQEVPVSWSKAFIARISESPDAFIVDLGLAVGINNIDTTDGLRITLENNDIIHLRPSGNAPELRCYAESKNELMAIKLVNLALSNVKKSFFDNISN